MGEKIQLLFVDDEEEFVNYMTKRLQRHELEIHAYTNPVEALEKTEGRTYDVGLLDLMMPEMDGEELLNRLKERDPTIEIIILTGHGSIESAFRSAQVGAYEYLLKPCDFDDLVSSINKAYAKRIRALSVAKAKQVDELMGHAEGMQPLALLQRLKKIHHGMTTFMSAAALAEGGLPDEAREFMGEKIEKDKEST
jgi:DNA-binding NtrC family response regulator